MLDNKPPQDEVERLITAARQRGRYSVRDALPDPIPLVTSIMIRVSPTRAITA